MRSFGIALLTVLTSILLSAATPIKFLPRGGLDVSANSGPVAANANTDSNPVSQLLDSVNSMLTNAENTLKQLNDDSSSEMGQVPARVEDVLRGIETQLEEQTKTLANLINTSNPLANRADVTQAPDSRIFSQLSDAVKTYTNIVSDVATLPGAQTPDVSGLMSNVSSQFATFLARAFGVVPGLSALASNGMGGLNPTQLASLLGGNLPIPFPTLGA